MTMTGEVGRNSARLERLAETVHVAREKGPTCKVWRSSIPGQEVHGITAVEEAANHPVVVALKGFKIAIRRVKQRTMA